MLILFAFLAGIVTILSPCILPILPIVLSSSVGSDHRRPFGVVLGFVGSFTFFTLALSSIVRATGIPTDALRNVAIGIVLVFGLSLLIPQTQLFLEKLFSKLANLSPRTSTQSGFMGGVVVGLSLGLLWAPCVGPILASVITLAATSTVNFTTFFITLAYAVGTALPMLVITYTGSRLFQQQPWLLARAAVIQKVFGGVMVAVALGMFFNLDRQFQAFILTRFPQYGEGLTKFEENDIVRRSLKDLTNTEVRSSNGLLKEGIMAPDFTGGTGWLNSAPLSLKKELHGKVVLVDFWTYSCINCIRTFPYLKKWYDTYKDKGFVIVGVHSPEFEFEKKTENVAAAAKDFGLEYPIVQDNDFTIWRAYENQYWPAHYLIDKNGHIRYQHFGEGKYIETENSIRMLLDEPPLSEREQEVTRRQQTPETYLGYERADAYVFDNRIQGDTVVAYGFQPPLPEDSVGLQGKWQVGRESITSHTEAQELASTLSLNFLAQRVHLVLSPTDSSKRGRVFVLLDGKPLPEKYWTEDMDEEGAIVVTEARKYDILNLQEDYGRHTIQLIFEGKIEAFAFTFG